MGRIEHILATAPLKVAAGWVLAWASLAAVMPVDAGYDVLNYHLYIGWAAAEGRLATDLMPAGMHSWFNPLYSLFVEALIDSLPAAGVSFVLGAIQALVFIALYCLCRRVLAAAGFDSRTGAALVALGGFVSAWNLHMLASIRNDHLTAGAFIAALLFIVRRDGAPAGWKGAAMGAFVTGLAVGLKLPGIIFVAGFAAAVLVAVPGWAGRAKAVAAAGAAGLAGILLTGGWWFHVMWEHFGNPVFPMANGLFHAPLGPDRNFSDTRYLPRGALDVLLYPLMGPFRPNEYPSPALQDFQIGLAYAGFAVLAFRLWKARAGQAEAPPRALLTVAAGALGTLALWFAMFGVGRYALGVWMLGPLLLVAALFTLKPAWAQAPRAALWLAALAIACLNCGLSVQVRRAPVADPLGAYVRVGAPEEIDFDHALVIFAGANPSAFLARGLPGTATYTSLFPSDWTAPAVDKFRPLIRERIDQARGPVIAVINTRSDVDRLIGGLHTYYGLEVNRADCRTLHTNFEGPEVGWMACPAQRRARA